MLFERLKESTAYLSELHSNRTPLASTTRLQKNLQMSERNQIQVLLSWMTQMIENFVRPVDTKNSYRIENATVVVCFVLSDLID